MSDHSPESDDAAESEDAEDGSEEYEVERVVTRADGAAVLRRLADGVANGSVELGDERKLVVPERFELEVEYEPEEDSAELEAELEWPIVDGEAVPAGPESDADERDDADAAGAEADDAESDRGDETSIDDDSADAERRIDEIVGAGGADSNARFELYRDRADEWRWRLVHDNGNIIADSGEGYGRKATARKGLESVMRNAPGATVDVRDD